MLELIIFLILLYYYLNYCTTSFETLVIDKNTILSSFDKIKLIAKNDNNCNILYRNLDARTKNLVYKKQMKINKYFKDFKLVVNEINYNEHKDKNLIQGEIFVSYEYTTIKDNTKKFDDSNLTKITGKISYDFMGDITGCNIRLGAYKEL